MILFSFRRCELDQIRCAAGRHFLGSCWSCMGTTHLLQFFPGTLVRIELQVLARMNLLPEETAFGIAPEHRDIDPDSFIIGIEHDDTSLQGGGLAHIAPLKTFLK